MKTPNAKNAKSIAVISSVIALVSLAGWVFSVTQGLNKNVGSGHSETRSEQEKIKWTCPMHPQIIQDKPGQCPICGMNLVPAEAGHAHDENAATQEEAPSAHASFHLTEGRQQMIGVKLGVAEKKPLFKTIEASGRVAFDPDLYTAQSEYVEALKQLDRVQDSPLAEVKHSAQRMVESAKLRLKILGLSDAQIKGLSNRDAVGSSLLLTNPGETLWIYAEVFEMDLPSVQPGQAVKISGGSLGSDEIPGKVVSVDRVINPATRTARVRIQALNARTALRPESFVNAAILAPLGEQVTVPFDAVFDTGKEAWVYIAGEQGAFEPRKVTISQRAGDEVAIAKGLKGGEKIVVSGNFLVDSESRLRGVQMASSLGAEDEKPKTPECPKGQVWHAQMGHCMQATGK
jgi:Cu(I)/Ag(I) efflux system membrane fusion protein